MAMMDNGADPRVENATADSAPFNMQRSQPGATADPATPEPSDARKALVKEWLGKIHKAEKKAGPAFDKMSEDKRFVSSKQWPGMSEDDQRYVLNICQRVVNQRVATLYAKNPRVVARRRPKMDFALWDEKPDSMQEALAAIMGARQAAATDLAQAQPGTPEYQMIGQAHLQAISSNPTLMNAMALLQDIYAGKKQRDLYDAVAKTLELLYTYFIEKAQPRFKGRLKKTVKRTSVTGVGYVKLGFLRQMSNSPDAQQKISDINQRLAWLKQAAANATEDDADPDSPEREALMLALKELVANPEIIAKAGLTFDFPLSHMIIVDDNCTQLVDFVGADWVAEKFLLTKEKVKTIYGCDVGSKYTGYSDGKDPKARVTQFGNYKLDNKTTGDLVCVYEVYDKNTGLMLPLADGYDDFLCEGDPGGPQIQLERFFPYWALVFNEMESEESIYPESDVRLIRHAQLEYNRKKEAERQHRIAAAPKYVTGAMQFDEEDDMNIANQPAHTVLPLKGLPDGGDIAKLIQRMPTANIDPNLYETESTMADIYRAVGTQEASVGGTSGDTATEVSVADASQQTASSSNGDDLDDLLTDLARCGGQVLLAEMDVESVKRIVGPGAKWPELTAADIADEIFLEIEAGSSGRPNKASDMANFQRLVPFLVQSPGINPLTLLRYAVKIMDDRLDPTDFVLENAPSIQALNALMSKPPDAVAGPGGAPAIAGPTPGAQGAQGADNQEQPPGAGGQAQPAYPAPGEGTTQPPAAAAGTQLS